MRATSEKAPVFISLTQRRPYANGSHSTFTRSKRAPQNSSLPRSQGLWPCGVAVAILSQRRYESSLLPLRCRDRDRALHLTPRIKWVCRTSLRSTGELSFAAWVLLRSIQTIHVSNVFVVFTHYRHANAAPACSKAINWRPCEPPPVRCAHGRLLTGQVGWCGLVVACSVGLSLAILLKHLAHTRSALECMDACLPRGQRAGLSTSLGSCRLICMTSGGPL